MGFALKGLTFFQGKRNFCVENGAMNTSETVVRVEKLGMRTSGQVDALGVLTTAWLRKSDECGGMRNERDPGG